jgi:hypothetical protein
VERAEDLSTGGSRAAEARADTSPATAPLAGTASDIPTFGDSAADREIHAVITEDARSEKLGRRPPKQQHDGDEKADEQRLDSMTTSQRLRVRPEFGPPHGQAGDWCVQGKLERRHAVDDEKL